MDRDPERRRCVVASRREAEKEGRAYEYTLAELRRARAYTQDQLAAVLDAPQSPHQPARAPPPTHERWWWGLAAIYPMTVACRYGELLATRRLPTHSPCTRRAR